MAGTPPPPRIPAVLTETVRDRVGREQLVDRRCAAFVPHFLEPPAEELSMCLRHLALPRDWPAGVPGGQRAAVAGADGGSNMSV
jgi:hypothetical protein